MSFPEVSGLRASEYVNVLEYELLSVISHKKKEKTDSICGGNVKLLVESEPCLSYDGRQGGGEVSMLGPLFGEVCASADPCDWD